MNTSPSISKIMPALLIAQRQMGAAKKGSVNPFFKSHYADLGSVMEVCKDALNDAEIVALQPVVGDKVVTTLIHSSGEFISDEGTPIVCSKLNDPQSQGSAITYARRYGLQSLLFIPAEDDDAESAMNREEKTGTTGVKGETTSELTATCRVHKDEFGSPIVLKHFEKDGREFWSHRLEDGTWCRGTGTK